MNNQYPHLKGCIFIVTYGRSGSTLLQSILQNIPNAHIRGENYNALAHLFHASRSLQETYNLNGQTEKEPLHPWYGADQVRPSRFEKKLARAFVSEVIRPPADVRWMGFKEIRYTTMTQQLPQFVRFCRRNFPNAHIVFNSRNAHDVAKSKWWAKQPVEQVVGLVSEMDQKFVEISETNSSFTHHVSYDEVVANPLLIKPLFDKLDEPFDLEAIKAVIGRKLTH